MNCICYMEVFMKDKDVGKGEFVFFLVFFFLFVEYILLFG